MGPSNPPFIKVEDRLNMWQCAYVGKQPQWPSRSMEYADLLSWYCIGGYLFKIIEYPAIGGSWWGWASIMRLVFLGSILSEETQNPLSTFLWV